MTDRSDPAAVITRLLHALDDLDWPAARDCLADEVTTDYTELFAGEPRTGTADALIEQWQGLLPGFDATQHLTGPVLVDPAGADLRAETHVRAHHRLGNDTWSVYGHYACTMREIRGRWRIAALTLQLHYQDGPVSLPQAATDRAGNLDISKPRHHRP